MSKEEAAKSAKAPRQEPDEELDSLAHKVIGAAIEVHRILGPGHLESIYEDALAIEFGLRGIPFERQKPLPVSYKGHKLHEGRVDFLIGGRLLVEIKAINTVPAVQKAIVIAYLRAANQSLALLINFNVTLLKQGIERIIFSV